jgi:hypothetical protein
MPPNLPYVDRSAVAPEVGQALEGLPDLNLSAWWLTRRVPSCRG